VSGWRGGSPALPLQRAGAADKWTPSVALQPGAPCSYALLSQPRPSDPVAQHCTPAEPPPPEPLADGMVVCHLPYGPTAYFGIFNTVLRHDIGQKKEVRTCGLRRHARLTAVRLRSH
jgi:hypothetical protein